MLAHSRTSTPNSSTTSLHDPYTSIPLHCPLSTTTTLHHDSDISRLAASQRALALLHQPTNCGSSGDIPTSSVAPNQPTSYPLLQLDGLAVGGDSFATSSLSSHAAAHDWHRSMYNVQTQIGMGGSVATHNYTHGVRRSHQRTPSGSTVASNGPASPFMPTGSYPHIANTDHAPHSPAYWADQALPKNLPTPSHTPIERVIAATAHMPSQPAHMPNAHLAMKDFSMDHHNPEDSFPDIPPSRQSISSYGNDSPATPQSGAGDLEQNQCNLLPNDISTNSRRSYPNLQLFRTDSQAFQDELYNPNAVYTSAPVQPSSSYLSPQAPRNMLSERLQTANLARSSSPASAMSRELSPFRDGSPLAPAKDWRARGAPVGTAANMRMQQKAEAAQAEYAQHRAPLRREATKTISPKDAVLDYKEAEQPSLFQDTIPEGYEKHLGGTEQWPSNFFGQTASFGDISANDHQVMNFRSATSDNSLPVTAFDFSQALPRGAEGPSNSLQPSFHNTASAKTSNFSDSTPEFPASMPSMDTSVSDAGVPASSQDSAGPTSMPQRPNDTRANTGTYTCTARGCSQRFDSPANLQKHKRDCHGPQQTTRDNTSISGTASLSPRSTASPAPSPTSGMTSSVVLARNSQAGPHKCTRINPSTGKPCNTIFSRPYDLTRHEDTIHNNGKQKVRCPMCREEKTFSRNDALTRHMRVVHPEVESFGKRGRRD